MNFTRTDLASDNNINNFKHLYYEDNNNIEVLELNNKKYRIIKFNNLNNHLITTLKNELNFFINKIKSKKSVLIIGLGNDNFTADSVGPKTLKGINVNAHLIDMGINTKNIKISALEPGVLGQTGIDTKRIIKSIIDEIKPDYLIIIDYFISNDINKIQKTIQITNEGITPGSGIIGINSKISKKTIGLPIIVIGVPTALETIINNQKLILSTNNIDKYVLEISNIISSAINKCLYFS